ncbi:hypothetical protein, partial [Pseudoalteromonas sp.]|uniref:hypothetical protein n=1 Tax=Pseudoalteromonas sp. TaxID=53249 RepID=UPI0035644D55
MKLTPLGFAISNINIINHHYLPEITMRLNTLKKASPLTEELKNVVFDEELSFILNDLDQLTTETV